MFKEEINHITGEREWRVTEGNDFDLAKEIAITGFGDMILDYDRNDGYEAGLISCISKKKANGEKANVVDIGTGTGLLSLMAARGGADSVKAVEVFKPMADIARKIFKECEYADKIKLITSRSTDLNRKDVGTKGNIIVAEVFDTELIGEGALRTFKEAFGVLVEKGSSVVPARATVFVVPFESAILRSFNKIDSINLDCSLFENCPGSHSVFDCQLSEMDLPDLVLLSDPIRVSHFNFEDPDSIIFDEVAVSVIKNETNQDHRLDGFIFWWDTDMTGNGDVIVSTVPNFIDPERHIWRDHWMPAVYYPPQDIVIKKNSELKVCCSHDEYSFWFNVGESSSKPACTCGMHMLFSRNSICRMNELSSDVQLLNLLSEDVKGKNVVCLNEGSLIGIFAAKDAKNVTILENNRHFHRILSDIIRDRELKNVELVDSIKSQDFDFILTEPFYMSAMLPWENLRYFFDKKKYCQNSKAETFLKKAYLKCVPLFTEHLWKIGAPVGIVSGFDLGEFDKVTQPAKKATTAIVEPHPLWEYSGVVAGDVQVLMEIDGHTQLSELECRQSIKIKNSDCNVIVFWMDWQYGTNKSIVRSTGIEGFKNSGRTVPQWNKFSKQGVFFIDKEMSDKLKEGHSIEATISMNAKGTLDFAFHS
uniref:Protein arginine N-methyltransferase n=1 Tax=Rhabditophanes sp. KR3021 TaxID=114890 RepID=A0AC35TVI6_9BILA